MALSITWITPNFDHITYLAIPKVKSDDFFIALALEYKKQNCWIKVQSDLLYGEIC
jgi:hypothetical protein